MSEEIEVEIKPKQRWVQILSGRTIRVMAITEGYCMVRFGGGMPFVIYHKELRSKYRLSLQSTKNDRQSSTSNSPS
jgi:hypothetical protein